MALNFYGPVSIGQNIEAGGIGTKVEAGATYNDYRTMFPKETVAQIASDPQAPDAATNEELSKYKDSKLLPYVINTQYPLVFIKNLHEKIKKEKQLEQRVAYIVEAVKNKQLSKLLPYEVFTAEFGEINKSTYYEWRKKLSSNNP